MAAVAEKTRPSWNATAEQTAEDVALFFLASALPDQLKDAPGGKAYLTTDESKLNRASSFSSPGAPRARHSGKQPPAEIAGRFP